jgi:hypothetical protein
MISRGRIHRDDIQVASAQRGLRDTTPARVVLCLHEISVIEPREAAPRAGIATSSMYPA